MTTHEQLEPSRGAAMAEALREAAFGLGSDSQPPSISVGCRRGITAAVRVNACSKSPSEVRKAAHARLLGHERALRVSELPAFHSTSHLDPPSMDAQFRDRLFVEEAAHLARAAYAGVTSRDVEHLASGLQKEAAHWLEAAPSARARVDCIGDACIALAQGDGAPLAPDGLSSPGSARALSGAWKPDPARASAMQASLREACRGRLLPPSLRLSLWRAYLVVPALEGRAAEALSRISGSQNQLRMPLLMRAALNRAEAALSATAPDGGSQAAAREGGSADGRLSPRPSGSLEAARGGDDGWKERAAPALNALHLMLGDSFDADAAVLLRLADTAVEAAAALGSDAAQGTDVTVLRSAITYTLATALWHSTATAGLRQAQRAVEALRGVDDELQTALGRQLTLDAGDTGSSRLLRTLSQWMRTAFVGALASRACLFAVDQVVVFAERTATGPSEPAVKRRSSRMAACVMVCAREALLRSETPQRAVEALVRAAPRITAAQLRRQWAHFDGAEAAAAAREAEEALRGLMADPGTVARVGPDVDAEAMAAARASDDEPVSEGDGDDLVPASEHGAHRRSLQSAAANGSKGQDEQAAQPRAGKGEGVAETKAAEEKEGKEEKEEEEKAAETAPIPKTPSSSSGRASGRGGAAPGSRTSRQDASRKRRSGQSRQSRRSGAASSATAESDKAHRSTEGGRRSAEAAGGESGRSSGRSSKRTTPSRTSRSRQSRSPGSRESKDRLKKPAKTSKPADAEGKSGAKPGLHRVVSQRTIAERQLGKVVPKVELASGVDEAAATQLTMTRAAAADPSHVMKMPESWKPEQRDAAFSAGRAVFAFSAALQTSVLAKK